MSRYRVEPKELDIHIMEFSIHGYLLLNVCAGTYVDTVIDGLGCVDTFTFEITEPDTLLAMFTDTTDALCNYSSDGQAIVTPVGGTPMYSYDWYDKKGEIQIL